MILDIGSGGRKGNGVIGLDLNAPADVLADLRDPLPFADETFEGAIADQVAEHVRTAHPYRLFDEVWRVLRPGGWFTGSVPGIDLDLDLAVRDPTHVVYFSAGSFRYLFGGTDIIEGRLARHDGRRAGWSEVRIEQGAGGASPNPWAWSWQAVKPP